MSDRNQRELEGESSTGKKKLERKKKFMDKTKMTNRLPSRDDSTQYFCHWPLKVNKSSLTCVKPVSISSIYTGHDHSQNVSMY